MAAIIVVAAVAVSCSSKVVATAPPPGPAPTTNTSVPTLNALFQHIDSDSALAASALSENPPTAAQIAGTSIEELRKRALATIGVKLTSLNAANAVLVTTTHLSPTALASEKAEIGTAVQGLVTLQATIRVETSIGVLRRDVAGLTSFASVGTVIVPKVGLLAAADQIRRGSDSMSQQASAIQTRINDAQARGKQVTSAQAALANLKASAAQAGSLANGLLQSVPSITATQVPQIAADGQVVTTAKAALANAQGDLGTISTALQAAGA